MNKRITPIIIIGLVATMGIYPFISQTTRAIPTLNVGWDQDPEIGWYGEEINFDGWADGGLPPYHDWDWSFGGDEEKEVYTWYPTESPAHYDVELSVYDSHTPNWFGKFSDSVEIQIEYDLTGSADASPTLASRGTTITIAITAHNNLGHHICPQGYNIQVKIYRLSGAWMADLEDITGPDDLSPNEDSIELNAYYYAPYIGVFYARVYFDTTYDQHTQDNIITSNLFTII